MVEGLVCITTPVRGALIPRSKYEPIFDERYASLCTVQTPQRTRSAPKASSSRLEAYEWATMADDSNIIEQHMPQIPAPIWESYN